MIYRQATALGLGRRRFLFNSFAFVIATVWASLMGLLDFVAVGAFAERGLAKKIVGASRAGSTFGVPSFWVRHGSTPHSRSLGAAFFCGRGRPNLLFLQPVLLQSRERSHSRVCCVGLTAAFFVIQIRAAIGAQSPAIALADDLHGQRQEHLLTQDVRQEQAFTGKKCDFRIVVLQPFLFRFGLLGKRRIRKIKGAGYFLDHGLEATRAR